jgi:hypothetical protein
MAARKDIIFEVFEGDKQYYFSHFATRLKQRYGLIIYASEYEKLCGQSLELLYKLSPNKRVGYVLFKGKKILVIRCNASKLLNTCLLEKANWPVPQRYKKIRGGVTCDQFNQDIKIALMKIESIIEYLKWNNNSTEKLYKERPLPFPDWIYRAAIEKHKNITNKWMVKIVKNLYNK